MLGFVERRAHRFVREQESVARGAQLLDLHPHLLASPREVAQDAIAHHLGFGDELATTNTRRIDLVGYRLLGGGSNQCRFALGRVAGRTGIVVGLLTQFARVGRGFVARGQRRDVGLLDGCARSRRWPLGADGWLLRPLERCVRRPPLARR